MAVYSQQKIVNGKLSGHLTKRWWDDIYTRYIAPAETAGYSPKVGNSYQTSAKAKEFLIIKCWTVFWSLLSRGYASSSQL